MAKFTDKTFLFELVSPERVIASEQVSMVVVPGTEGDFGVLAQHAPLLSTVRAGVLSIHTPAGDVRQVFVSGGFADVTGTLCSVLVEEALPVDELNREAIEQKIKALKEDLKDFQIDDITEARINRDIAIEDAKLLAIDYAEAA